MRGEHGFRLPAVAAAVFLVLTQGFQGRPKRDIPLTNRHIFGAIGNRTVLHCTENKNSFLSSSPPSFSSPSLSMGDPPFLPPPFPLTKLIKCYMCKHTAKGGGKEEEGRGWRGWFSFHLPNVPTLLLFPCPNQARPFLPHILQMEDEGRGRRRRFSFVFTEFLCCARG